MPEPGLIRHATQNRFLIGEPSRQATRRTARLIDALQGAGVGAIHHTDIHQQYWTKLMINLTFAPVSILSEVTNDQFATDPAVRAVMIRMMREAFAVGEAFGLEPGAPAEERIDMGASFVGVKTSTLQDLEKGRPVELDAIMKSVIEMGRIANRPTPTIDTVFALAAQRARLAGVYS